jgi:hypothetical protein
MKQANGSKGNPYKVEATIDHGKPINLKNGEKIHFTIVTPIREVFGESQLLDFEHPYLQLLCHIIIQAVNKRASRHSSDLIITESGTS